MYEYAVEHDATLPVDETWIRRLVGSAKLETLDFNMAIVNETTVVIMMSGTDASRIAFAKVIQKMCSLSEKIVISEL